ncbi:MAG: HTH domain-containing protein, partial [Culicoidibacterales bacterium]
MSKKLFTEKEIKQLQKNPYVKNVTKKGVTYTDEMRKF